MRYRVALWGLVGFLIAAGWAVFLWATFPTFHSRELMDVARLTCPISVIGERYHFGVWVGWVLGSNAAIYGLIGLALETLGRLRWRAKTA